MDKKTFIIYKSWEGAIDKMTDEQVGQLFRKIYHPEMDITDPVVDILWGIVSQRLDEDSEKYAAKVERINKVNESKRNRDDIVTKSKRNRDDIVSDTDTVTDTVTVTETDTVSPTEIKKETPTESRKKFSPPSAEEVAAYCRERQNKVNADTFVDFYTAKGWKVGNTPMKDWKAAVRTWEKRDGGRASPVKPTTKFTNYEEREIDFDSLEARFARN